MNSINEKVLSLAKKLKALSDRGVGGEKENATQMLVSLMERHNITIEMIAGDERKTHQLFLDPTEEKFLRQVISSVVGRGFRLFQYKYKMVRIPGKLRYGIEKITDAEFLEVMAKHAFYYADYQDQIRIFYSAYVQKNKLYVRRDESEDDSPRELTPEEKREILKISLMMEGIERKLFVKQIEK